MQSGHEQASSVYQNDCVVPNEKDAAEEEGALHVELNKAGEVY